MKRLRILVPLTLLTLFLFGCREDLDLTVVDSTQEPPTVTEGTANFTGKVMDASRTPLAGVTVELIGIGLVTTTDEEGRYGFPISPLLLDGTMMRFTRDFLVEERRFITAKTNSDNFVDVVMEPAPVLGFISGEAGGNIITNIPFLGTLAVSIPAGAARANGQIYNGQIEVGLNFLDATDPTAIYQSGNNFPANDPVRGNVLLESYGLAQLRLSGEAGEAITFPDNSATLSVPFPNFNGAVQQDTLFTWKLTDTGWERLGFIDGSTSIPTALTTPVSGSGDYNWAIPFPQTMLTGRLLSEAGVPQPFLNVFVQIRNGGVVYSARTGLDGSFCAPIPLDQELEINYNRPCFASEPGVLFDLFFDEIGPFSGPVDLGDVTKEFNTVAFPAISGGCNNNLLNQVNDLLVYVDGQPTGELVRNSEGNVRVVANDCDQDGVVTIQTVRASNPFATSRLETRSLTNTELLVLLTCSDLEEGEFLDINFGSQDTTASAASYLLTREGEEFRERVSFRGGNPQVSSSFELTLTFPFGGDGVYFAPEATVELLEFTDETAGFSYRCVDEASSCQSLVINVDNTTADPPQLNGTLNYVAEKVDLATGEVVETDISINAAFGIVR